MAYPSISKKFLKKTNILFSCCTVSVVLLVGCASTTPSVTEHNLNASLWARQNQLPVTENQRHWVHQSVGNRPVSSYIAGRHAGRAALEARSERGDSLVRLPVQADGPDIGRLRFSLWVDELNAQSDLADRQLDDAVARVILQFEGDRSTFSARDNMVSDLLQALTGEPLPYATLIYVWDHKYPVGTIIAHARSQRIKSFVIESGDARLGQWVDFERDISADFHKIFGHAPQRLKGIALMTDSNNTQQPSKAWYGPIQWVSLQ